VPINTPARCSFPYHQNRAYCLLLVATLPKSQVCSTLELATNNKMVSFSFNVVALAAIFPFLLTYGSCARPVNFNASAFTADPNWEAARATWYGAPTGAGPDDDGTHSRHCWCMDGICHPILISCLLVCCVLERSMNFFSCCGIHAGGACGFKNVNLPPFSSMTSCGNEPLFKDGKGCGSCYQVGQSQNYYFHFRGRRYSCVLASWKWTWCEKAIKSLFD
jgi:hypothetical protein